MPARAAIEVDSLTLAFISREKATLVLQDVSFSAPEGCFVALLGPSGCGKSTLLHTIAGLLTPTRGEVRLFGKPVRGPSPAVGIMFQQDYLLPWRTVAGNVQLAWELRRERPKPERLYALLEEVDLRDAAHRYPQELSGGMRQRAALVRTLVTDPAVLLLDEPFSALDYTTRLRLGELVHTVLRRHRKTALFVTHDIPEAISLADRILLMGRNPGRIVATFVPPPELAQKPPLARRTDPAFPRLFERIWEEMRRVEDERPA
ncbi:MAG: Hydroxymethylpyrimidine ABC transporter, ATPase component [Brockia lithotrophica]|uniref:Hydroxymethylpyrimidine ABC transporter, ATPase component n=1 Tax=Brockia lithotrophica TaxID=933949 RepID=A0A2T5G7A2_9BACL|nr:MAG: Hydroxymethylpyrimidine ABC transporter, ATPase component [Brockia lithotrophica]